MYIEIDGREMIVIEVIPARQSSWYTIIVEDPVIGVRYACYMRRRQFQRKVIDSATTL